MKHHAIGIALLCLLSFLAGWFLKVWHFSRLSRQKHEELLYRRSLKKLRDHQKNVGRRIYNALATANGKVLMDESFSKWRDEGDPAGLYKILFYGGDNEVFEYAGITRWGSPIFWIEIDSGGPDPIEVVRFSGDPAVPDGVVKTSIRLGNDDESVQKLIDDLRSQYFKEIF